MTTRIKSISEIRSRAEFDQILENIVTMQLAKERTELRRDKKLLAIRAEYAVELNDLALVMETNVLRAEKYATAHRDELLPGKKKTAETSVTFFGFRTGNPTLVLLNRKWTWAKVITALKLYAEGRKFIIVKESPDKDAMKLQLSADHLAAVGTRIEQSETFFIDPKRDPADPRRLVTSPQSAIAA